MMMTFEEFRATRRDVADVRDMIEHSYLEDAPGPVPGLVYLDALVIETRAPWWKRLESYCLTIGNQQYGGHVLRDLEQRLYEFACGEGLCGEEPEQSEFDDDEGVAYLKGVIAANAERRKIEEAAEAHARLTLGQLAKVLALNAELLDALIWLVDDMTDAGEGDSPVTGEPYDSVANARAAIAKAKAEGLP
jgi:hypothetical protein